MNDKLVSFNNSNQSMIAIGHPRYLSHEPIINLPPIDIKGRKMIILRSRRVITKMKVNLLSPDLRLTGWEAKQLLTCELFEFMMAENHTDRVFEANDIFGNYRYYGDRLFREALSILFQKVINVKTFLPILNQAFAMLDCYPTAMFVKLCHFLPCDYDVNRRHLINYNYFCRHKVTIQTIVNTFNKEYHAAEI